MSTQRIFAFPESQTFTDLVLPHQCVPVLSTGTLFLIHHRTFERLGNSNKFYLTILARELASNSIFFPSSPPYECPSKGIPYEIDELLKEFANIILDELLGKLPPLKDIKHAMDLVPGFQLPNLPSI